MTNKEILQKIDIEVSWLSNIISKRRDLNLPLFHETNIGLLLEDYRKKVEYDMLKVVDA